MGPQYRRAFPKWLEQCHGTLVTHDYRFFVYEWGEILNMVTHRSGRYPGELDRVFWNSLRGSNLLRSKSSRYRNHLIERDQDIAASNESRFFEGLSDCGTKLCVVMLRPR